MVDIGTNSTRLLVADVQDGRVRELDRRSTVTRLGQGVDATGRLAPEATQRVFDVLDSYRPALPDRNVALLTSAVRDATNGAEFTKEVRERYGLDARTIPGEEEARLTFSGATSERDPAGTVPTVVMDIGGGSTEFVIGTGRRADFHVSTQAGVVRQTERHLHRDPPSPEGLAALAADARATIESGVPHAERARARAAIAVAGTATSLAAIELGLEPYDPERAHGHVLRRSECEAILARLAALPLAERRTVPGLDPDRAPTILAGVLILLEALRSFGLDEVEVSEHDILRGAALALAAHR